MTDQEIDEIFEAHGGKFTNAGQALFEHESLMRHFARDVLSRAIPEGHVVVPKNSLVRAYGMYRTNPEENDGKEFFYYAMWHNDTIPGDGERSVPGHFLPDESSLPAAPANKEG